MKFGKELAAQLVPEWEKAYIDYNFLKTLLKDIQSFKQTRTKPIQQSSDTILKRNLTRYRAFSGLLHQTPISPNSPNDIENQSIHVHSVHRNGWESYETTFLMAGEDGGEYELVYFRRLDDEFNKVDRFYREKVEEVVKEALVLNKQMDGLIGFRIKVENPNGYGLGFDRNKEMNRLFVEVENSTSALSVTTPSGAKESGRIPMQVIEEVIARKQEDEDEDEEESSEDDKFNNQIGSMDQNLQLQVPKKSRNRRPAPLEILSIAKPNNTLETPRSTIKRILKDPKQGELSFNRENLQKVEDRLKRAFVEFYHKLRLLKNYCFLNTLAISKIMKKYDKIASRSAAKPYMRMVDKSYLGRSDEVTKLMQRVEETFIKHFSNSNRSKGMNILRLKAKKERHRITFSTGFFVGCAAALLIALILIIRARNIMDQKGRAEYMETMFPLYSLFGFMVLHMLMYAGNIYFWRRYRVNYSFIFGFKQGTELGYREVLLVSFVIGVLALSSVLSNLDMEMDPNTHDYKEFTELVPLNVLFGLMVILFCPLNIIYRSSRFFFLVCLFHSICAPLYKVTLPDFFLADQLTSQVQAFRSLEFYICYYGWGDYKHRRNTCKSEPVYNSFYFIVATIPYWSRFLQCIRRLVEERDPMQGYNGLKYFVTVVAVCLRTAYSINKGMGWKVVAGIFSAIAALFCTYWDLVHDWGLLKPHSKNRWLRDKMLVPHKSVYFGAMVLNVLLRFAWLQTVLDFQVSFLHRETLIVIVASLEIIRRGIWNFFRLENEHLNNVGHYRAFKSVPLPFNYGEDEDKDE